MKICARLANKQIDNREFVQLKVWVDELERQSNHEKVAFPCHSAYMLKSYLDARNGVDFPILIQNVYALFMNEFCWTTEDGEGIVFSYPFDYESFECAVSAAVKPGSIGMSCDKDVDNPDHWVEIGADARSPDDDTPSPRIRDVEAYKTFMKKAEVFEYICDGCALGTILGTTLDDISFDILNDIGDGDGKVYIVHEDHFKLPSPFVDDFICTLKNKDKSDVKLILKYSDLDDEGVKEIQGREICIYRVTGTRDFVIRVLK